MVDRGSGAPFTPCRHSLGGVDTKRKSKTDGVALMGMEYTIVVAWGIKNNQNEFNYDDPTVVVIVVVVRRQ